MMKNTLTLSLLQTFVVVADKKNMVSACAVLHITQPAVSMQLSRLKEIVGDDLFHDTKRYELTDVGRRLLGEARLILDMSSKVPGMGTRSGLGHLNIGFSIDAYEFAQGSVTREFSQDHLLKIHCMSSGETLAAALDGCLDVAVVFLPPSYSGPSVGEISCRLVLAHLGETPSPATPGRPFNLATYGPTCPYRLTALKYFAEMAVPFAHSHIASSPAGLREVLASGGICAPIPLFLKRNRYVDTAITTDIVLPNVRLGLLANNLRFRHANQAKLWRVLSWLTGAVAAAEALEISAPALPSSTSVSSAN